MLIVIQMWKTHGYRFVFDNHIFTFFQGNVFEYVNHSSGIQRDSIYMEGHTV